MEGKSTGEHRAQEEEKRLTARAMLFLTGGLTHEPDTFVIGAGTVLLLAILYPLIGAWSFLAFPAVFMGAVLTRGRSRGRREIRRSNASHER